MINSDNTPLNDLELDDLLTLSGGGSNESNALQSDKLNKSFPVAVIGLSGQIGGSDDLDQFWHWLCRGYTTGRSLPSRRKRDLDVYLKLKGAFNSSEQPKYFHESFLKNIDEFDYRFFGIALKEASLIDPNQRLFLQTAWSALEHAGYGADSKGSDTGVFVGFSQDFGDAYRDIIGTLAPEENDVSVVGNIKSIIASRIAYLLDLRGPSMMVDTACSSGAVSVHLACQALSRGDCKMALAGSVKIDLVPVENNLETGVGLKDVQGITSEDGLTRSFDDSSDGFSGAEGVVAFLLKPLDKALEDGDYVHAVIAGSAVNQDGQSIGITAPNRAAQESLIIEALKNAEVHPDSVSYIEAHGTATPLGDPVEVSAIHNAFQRYSKKKQFCGVGSVKSNLGHMDNASGLAGLAKVVLSMRHKQLPASINFNRPNRQIDFINSPVYVVDTHREWLAEHDQPLRAGVSSFGLSGTNCHLVVEAGTESTMPAIMENSDSGIESTYVLCISAESKYSLTALIGRYFKWISSEAKCSLNSLCYTAAVGRQHFKFRIALVFSTHDELTCQLKALEEFSLDHQYNGVQRNFEITKDKLVLMEAKRSSKELGDSLDLQSRYLLGGDMDWSTWYQATYQKVPLPTYPFEPTRCWVEQSEEGTALADRRSAKTHDHPLIDRKVVSTIGSDIYELMIGVETHWELSEHKIGGQYVLPGTAYVEMIFEVLSQFHGGTLPSLQCEKVFFIEPLILKDGGKRKLQFILDYVDARKFGIRIVSYDQLNARWQVHVEASAQLLELNTPNVQDLRKIQSDLNVNVVYTLDDDAALGLEIGDRWQLSVIRASTNSSRTEVLVKLALPEPYISDSGIYHYHPALLDNAVNAANHVVGEGLYLPFAYPKLSVYKPLPNVFFVHTVLVSENIDETIKFDINVLDENGGICASVEGYTVKRVNNGELVQHSSESDNPSFLSSRVHRIIWNRDEEYIAPDQLEKLEGTALWIGDLTDNNLASFKRNNPEVNVEVIELDEHVDSLSTSPFKDRIKQFEGLRFDYLVFGCGASMSSKDQAITSPTSLLNVFVEFVQIFVSHKIRIKKRALVLCPYAYNASAIDAKSFAENIASPGMSSLAALVRTAGLENPQLKLSCIDAEVSNIAAAIECSFRDESLTDHAVYRNHEKYSAQLDSVNHPAEASLSLSKEGVYLVTGGLGALGLALAEHLAELSNGAINLALMSSSEFPDRQTWVELLASPTTPKQMINAIEGIYRLESLGSKVCVMSADVADQGAVEKCLLSLREEFGKLNGVVHTAGRAGEGYLHNKRTDVLNRVLSAKIEGAWNLHTLTQDDVLEFFVMYSSIATVLLSAGQTDYTAANAYLDALAQYRRHLKLPAHAIIWPAWREVGIAYEYDAINEDEFFAPISPKEALPLATVVLADTNELPASFIVAEINRNASLSEISDLGIGVSKEVSQYFSAITQSKNTVSQFASTSKQLISLQLSGADDGDEVAQAVGQVWAKVLGETELNTTDEFSELGGNSILTTQLFREFDILYPDVMDISDLFSNSTIESQIKFIKKSIGIDNTELSDSLDNPSKEQDMDSVLAKLADGSLSAEEAQLILTT